MYDQNVLLFIILTIKSNFAFFIFSHNLKNNSIMKTLIVCFSSIMNLVERINEALLISNSVLASLCQIFVIILSNCCINLYSLFSKINLDRHLYSHTFVCSSSLQINFSVNMSQHIFSVWHKSP